MAQRKPAKRTDAAVVPAPEPTELLADLRGLIHQAREGVARAVDSSLTTLYWHVGRRIRQDILREKRADYGGLIVAAMGRQLEAEFGRGFGEKNLRRMIQFAEVFPDLAENVKRTRGKQKSPTKQLVSLRLDREVLEAFKASGEGWQSRINETLRRAAKLRASKPAA